MFGMKGWDLFQVFRGVSFVLWESKLFQKRFFSVRDTSLGLRSWHLESILGSKKVSTILTTNRATTLEEIPPPPHTKIWTISVLDMVEPWNFHEHFLIARVAAGMLKREATSWQHQAWGFSGLHQCIGRNSWNAGAWHENIESQKWRDETWDIKEKLDRCAWLIYFVMSKKKLFFKAFEFFQWHPTNCGCFMTINVYNIYISDIFCCLGK